MLPQNMRKTSILSTIKDIFVDGEKE